MSEQETVTITKQDFKLLVVNTLELRKLQEYGVDNWEGMCEVEDWSDEEYDAEVERLTGAVSKKNS